MNRFHPKLEKKINLLFWADADETYASNNGTDNAKKHNIVGKKLNAEKWKERKEMRDEWWMPPPVLIKVDIRICEISGK